MTVVKLHDLGLRVKSLVQAIQLVTILIVRKQAGIPDQIRIVNVA